jgi:hypothetical protein
VNQGEIVIKKTLTVLIGIGLALTTATAAWAGPTADREPRARSHNGRTTRASGQIVVDWNRELLSIVRTPGAQPATVHPTRSFAILQASIYDAVAAIDHQRPYLFAVRANPAARPDAAAAAAGHDALAGLYPTMKPELDQRLAAELATIPDGRAKQQGIRDGQLTAAIMLAVRAHDGSDAAPSPPDAPTAPGQYRPTPPAFAPPVFTHWSAVTPFVLDRASQFRPAAPPALSSTTYAAAINEVKAVGQDSSSARTTDQTTQAKFWAAPIWNYWNEIADNAVLAHNTSLDDSARVLAELDLSFADGVIAFYDAKYHYNLWRPVTAVRAADTDGNPATAADPNWTPLASTPADPSYPGAHSVISSAGATILSAFFGRHDHIVVTSEVLPGVTRQFDNYRAVETEAGLSRIYAGVHTRLDHEAGLRLGLDVANDVMARGV